MDKIKQMQLLVAEIGVFFANCDGIYDSREQSFIENFVKELDSDKPLTEEVKNMILNESKSIESIETIVQMTKDLLVGFNDAEQDAIKDVLSTFIEKVINADDIVHENEANYYAIWKKQVGIE